MRLQILGPLRVWRGDVEIHSGPRQQAHLLALLLARQGWQTSVGGLIDMIWGHDAPVSATNAIHKYVGSLRRMLEPTLPTRQVGSYLLRRGNGYLCSAGPDVLDLARFRQLVGRATAALRGQELALAHEDQVRALELWTGPAAADLTYGPGATPAFARLNEEFLGLCVSATDVAVALGEPRSVVPSLRLAAAMAPLHEPVHASLMLSLAAAGHQAESLSVFGEVRLRLADELGVDPGAALQAAHRQVLAQSTGTVVPKETRVAVRRSKCPHGESEARSTGGSPVLSCPRLVSRHTRIHGPSSAPTIDRSNPCT